MANDLIVRVDATTAQFDKAMSSAQKATLRYEATLKTAQKAQLEFDAAVAASGASSQEAALAQQKLGAALARTTEAEIRAGTAAKAAGEIQAASSAKAAAASEAAAAKQAAAFKKIGTIAGGVGLAAAAGLAVAAKAAADFNAKMAQVQSLTKASAGEMDALSHATEGFAGIGASASDAADAEIELVKAGISVADITGGALAGAMNLAAAGQIDFGTATEIAAQAMTQFQLKGKDIPHLADLLAAGADRALGSVQDLGEGLSYVGLGAHQLGISVDDTVAALSEFANAGLLGSQGGTTLQQVLRQLTGPTDKAAEEIQTLGLNLYDAQGNFVGLASVAGQLQEKLGGMSQQQRDVALNTLFTSRAVRGATILYQDGAKGVEKWQQTVEESGFAAEQASGKMDSLQGDLEKLKANATNAAIGFGQQLQPALRATAQAFTSMFGVVDDLPGPLKEIIALTVAFTAVVGLGTFAYTRAATALTSMGTSLGVAGAKMAAIRGSTAAAGIGLEVLGQHLGETHETLGALTQAAGAAALGFSVGGPWGAAIGGGIGLITAFSQQSTTATISINGLTDTLDQNTGAVTANTKAWADKKAVEDGVYDQLTRLGIATTTYSKALQGNREAIQAVRSAVGGDIAGYAAVVDPLNKAIEATRRFREEKARDAEISAHLQDQTHALGGAVDEFGHTIAGAGDDFHKFKQGADDASAAVDEFTKATEKALAAALRLDNLSLGRQGDWDNFAASIDAASQALKDNGKTLDQNTEKGRANRGVLRDMATSTLALAADYKDGSDAQVTALEKGRTALYKQAIAFGDTKAEAEKYTNSVLGIPDEVKTKTDFDYKDSLAHSQQLIHQYDLTPKEVHTVTSLIGAASTIGQLQSIIAYENALQGRHVATYVDTYLVTHSAPGGRSVYTPAAGGYITGPGTATSDSIPAMVSNGEYVMRAAAVQKYGLGLMHAYNSGAIAPGSAPSAAAVSPTQARAATQSFAKGGAVGRQWSNGRVASVVSAPNVTVQAPSGPFKVQLDLGGGHTVTGLMTRIAESVVDQDGSHRGTMGRM